MKIVKRYALLGLMLAALCFTYSSDAFAGYEVKPSGERPADSTSLHYIFEAGGEGYACFRIPALVRTEQGTLLAFAEGRKRGCSDTGDIDLVMKRSHDGGKTWGGLEVLWDDGDNTCGNPAPVVDRETGKIFLLLTWNLGTDHEKEILGSTSQDTRHVFVTSSDDDGKTWSTVSDITMSVKRKNWTWYATGPGAGIQLTKSKYAGRLIIACDHILAGSKTGYSHVIYSDNHGKKWKLGGISPRPQTNESTVAELSNGEVMLNMRNYDREVRHRQVIKSDDGGKSWEDGYADEVLLEPICQGKLINHRFPVIDQPHLVFSNPANKSKRMNMTIKVSKDDGKNWFTSHTVHEGPSAYSDMVSFPDGNLGILYEGGMQGPYEGIAFEIIKASELLDED
jgi:sialidase-1